MDPSSKLSDGVSELVEFPSRKGKLSEGVDSVADVEKFCSEKIVGAEVRVRRG